MTFLIFFKREAHCHMLLMHANMYLYYFVLYCIFEVIMLVGAANVNPSKMLLIAAKPFKNSTSSICFKVELPHSIYVCIYHNFKGLILVCSYNVSSLKMHLNSENAWYVANRLNIRTSELRP